MYIYYEIVHKHKQIIVMIIIKEKKKYRQLCN